MKSLFPPPTERSSFLPLKAIAPGLIIIVVMNILAVSGLWPSDHPRWTMASTLMLWVIPWATLIVLRRSPTVFAYRGHRAGLNYAWGVLAGAIWRGLSMFFNYRIIHAGSVPVGGISVLFAALIWVPFIEETFFRGYLGKTLNANLGPAKGIFLQSVFFTFQPVHWQQGWLSLISVFVFGVIAGWLVERWDSIWAGWGAHGFANVLPGILRLFV
ncbi:MAG: CPBP family intramembrane glutamic endopeptidase [Anaerolineales bacterium]